MKGYKVFNPNWICNGYDYKQGGDTAVGTIHEMKNSPIICEVGFHGCLKLIDCFNYYSFDPQNKVAEVEFLGEIQKHDNDSDDSKIVTNKIRIVRELTWHEVLDVVNTGKCNTGKANTGNRNAGDWNTGYGNTGDWNTGDQNTGNWNTGDRNTGNGNTGNRNMGDWNTGDFNSCDFSAGIFCTQSPKLLSFDKPTKITLPDWRTSNAYYILCRLCLTQWIRLDAMNPTEKEQHPECETLGGYLKQYTYQEAWKNLWASLSEKEKKVIFEIPNFDKEKFQQITGLKLE
jgi:hypothetical protein